MERDGTGDGRGLKELAQEALDVQDACNLSGVVHGWSRSIRRLRALLPGAGTDALNAHCVNVLWSDKCASLTGAQYGHNFSWMYDACQRLAAGLPPPPPPAERVYDNAD